MKESNLERKQNRLIKKTYYKYGRCVEINMLDISKVFAAGRAALNEGRDLDQAIQEIITKLRKN